MTDKNDTMDLLTIEEMRRILKISTGKTRMLLEDNIIPSVLVGKRSRRVRRRDLQAYLDSLSDTYVQMEQRVYPDIADEPRAGNRFSHFHGNLSGQNPW